MKSCSALRPYLAALLILVAAGFALRLAAAWNINQVLPDTADRLVGDEWSYDLLARELLQGTFSTQAGRTPIYPLFLAFSYSAFGDSFARALYVQTLISVMAVPLTFRLARYFTDVPSSVIAAGLVAFHPVLIRQAENIYTEAFYTPLLALTVLTIVWATRSPQIHRFLVTGALLGILNLTRPTGIFLPALLPLIVPHAWSWRRRVGLSGIAVVAMLVIIAPWTYHNYQVHHTFLLLSVTSYALWQASPEYYHLMESGYNFWDVLYSHIFPVYYEGYDPYTLEGSRYFNERAFISIQSEPFVFLWFAVQKLLFFWIGHPMYPWDWPFNLAAVQNHWKTEWRIIGFYASRVYPIVTLLALLAMPQSFRHFRSLLIICVYFTVFHALTNAETRYSEPLHPLLAIIIATALARFAKQGWARLHGVNPLVRN